jgi:hypothetical protein
MAANKDVGLMRLLASVVVANVIRSIMTAESKMVTRR